MTCAPSPGTPSARLPIAVIALACVAVTCLSGCGSDAAPAPAGKPPPLVDVVTLRTQPVPITTTLPGRTVAYRIAEVRPQVSGIILKRSFVEGSRVKAGQTLYQIDPAPYQAAYDSAKAALANAQAALKLAALKVGRYGPLAAANAISKLDYATAQATEQQDEAGVAAAKAALETARINLRYTKVRSPISGRTGRSLVTEGALVTGNQNGVLTTIQQLDPIYVDAPQPSAVLLRLRREYAAGKLSQAGDHQAPVRLTLGDGSDYGPAGKLQFSEVTVDPSTGSVTLRAVFPNPKHLLLPGMFVHLHINEGTRQNALLVPQKGLTHGASGQASALIVDADGKVEQRTVTAERAIGDQWLVTAGLEAGDRVIVKGLQFVKPGAKVRVQEVHLAESAPISAASSASAPTPSASAG